MALRAVARYGFQVAQSVYQDAAGASKPAYPFATEATA